MNPTATGQRQRDRGKAASLLCLCFLPLLAGCGGARDDALQLTLISPHRDEVREEVAWAFSDWFRQRTADRAGAARQAVEGWLADPGRGQESVTRSLAELLRDWSADEPPELRAAYRAWTERPDAQTGQSVLGALTRLRERPPNVQFVWQDVGGGTSLIARYIESRYGVSPGGIRVDLLFGGGTDIYLRFANQGFLQRIDLPAPLLSRIRTDLNGVPLYDPGGRWYGPMLSSFGILSNRRVLERIGQPEPEQWADLGRPGLRSWVGAGDPRMTGSVHMVYEIILQGPLGWDDGFRLLLRLGANTHTFIRDSGTLTRVVVNGEVAAAGNLDANALPAIAEDPEGIRYHLPEGETIINPDAVAVLKGAPHPQLARAFVEFLLSDAGQLLFLLLPGEPGGPRRFPLCRLSVVESLYEKYPPSARSVGAADPFKVHNTIRYDSKLGIRRWDALNDLFGAWIVDAHPDLSAAWRAVLGSQKALEERERLTRELFRPPCSAADLDEYARRIVNEGPRVRTATVTRWGEEARRRYRRVRESAEN